MKQGKSLEKLIEYLEKALIENKNVTITSPKKIRDRITGKLREHDVVIEIREGHHASCIAIECRDRSRPITVNEVESFWKKCDDTGINQGIIVSTKGFYKTAKKKALFLGIRCLELEQVKSLNRNFLNGLNPMLTIQYEDITNIRWNIVTIVELENKQILLTFIDRNGNGKEMSTEDLTKLAVQKFRKLPPDFSAVDKQVKRVIFDHTNIFLVDKSANKYIPLETLTADVEYTIRRETSHFDFFSYHEEALSSEIANFALAKYTAYKNNLRLLVMQKDNGDVNLALIPEKP